MRARGVWGGLAPRAHGSGGAFAPPMEAGGFGGPPSNSRKKRIAPYPCFFGVHVRGFNKATSKEHGSHIKATFKRHQSAIKAISKRHSSDLQRILTRHQGDVKAKLKLHQTSSKRESETQSRSYICMGDLNIRLGHHLLKPGRQASQRGSIL